MTASEQCDVIVIGGGLLGLSAARALAGRGRMVTVLEQAEVGHPAGGSHGSCRIFRLGYGDPWYVSMARQAREFWYAAEAQAGAQFLYPAPHLTFGELRDAVQAAMRAAGTPGELLTAAEVAARFPVLATGGAALAEPGTCIIAADQVLRWLAASSADLRTGVRVRALRDDGRRVTVSTDRGEYTAPVVIVTAGPWTSGLLGPAGLPVPARPTLEQVGFLTAAADGPAPPVFICHSKTEP